MNGSIAAWALLLLGFGAANLPFLSNRLLLLGPHRPSKALGWRLLELLLLAGLTIVLGVLVEARQGQRAPQGWEFYATVVCLMLTFAFPGFVWRVLRRHADTRSAPEQ